VSAIGWRGRAAALGLFALLVLAVGLLLGSGSGDGRGDGRGAGAPGGSMTARAHRALAGREVRRLLNGVVLPAGATATDPRPLGDRGAPLPVAGGPRAPDVVVRGRTWRVPESVAVVTAFLRAHPPPGTAAAAAGAGGAAAGGLVDALVAPTRGLNSAELSFTLLADGPRATIVHVDAAVSWSVPRPSGEVVPAGVHELDILRGRPGGRAGIALRVTDPQLSRIRRLIDALPTVQPGTVDCPVAVTGLPVVTFVFRAAEGGRPLAVARETADVVSPTTACDPLSFSVRGRARTPLLGGARLLRQVSRIVGRRLWLAPYAA
jgi:hypothetical protein